MKTTVSPCHLELQGQLQAQLRGQGLRVTRARSQVLLTIALASRPLACQTIFQELMRHGQRSSLGTVYRVVEELRSRGILAREWDTQRRSLFRLLHPEPEPGLLHLSCPETGRRLSIQDAELLAHIAAVARQQGFDPGAQSLRLEATPPPR